MRLQWPLRLALALRKAPYERVQGAGVEVLDLRGRPGGCQQRGNRAEHAAEG